MPPFQTGALNRPGALQVYDPVLTNLVRAYRPANFIARSLMPTIPVAKLSGQYPIFEKAPWFKVQADNRSQDRSPAKEVDYTWSLDTFLAEEFQLKVSWSDLESEQALDFLQFQRTKAEFLTDQMELAHELRVRDFLLPRSLGGEFNSALTHTPADKWDTAAGDPEKDFKIAVLAVRRKSGFKPTHAVLDFEVAYAMALNPKIRDLLKYDASGAPREFVSVGERVLPASIHGVQLVIAESQQMAGAEKADSLADESSDLTAVWGKGVRFVYFPTGSTWGKPSSGYVLQHTAKRITRWTQIDPDVTYIREQERYDIKAVAPDAFYYLDAVIS